MYKLKYSDTESNESYLVVIKILKLKMQCGNTFA